jgi:hypothetical protein
MYSDAAGDFGTEPSIAVIPARIHAVARTHAAGVCVLETYVCLYVCVCAPVPQHVWGFVCVEEAEDVRINEHLSICTARPSAIGCGEYAGPLLHLLVADTSQPQLLHVRATAWQ